jgi:hypothetical protein
MKIDTPWNAASNPLLGISEMLDYWRDHFGQLMTYLCAKGLLGPDGPAAPIAILSESKMLLQLTHFIWIIFASK